MCFWSTQSWLSFYVLWYIPNSWLYNKRFTYKTHRKNSFAWNRCLVLLSNTYLYACLAKSKWKARLCFFHYCRSFKKHVYQESFIFLTFSSNIFRFDGISCLVLGTKFKWYFCFFQLLWNFYSSLEIILKAAIGIYFPNSSKEAYSIFKLW